MFGKGSVPKGSASVPSPFSPVGDDFEVMPTMSQGARSAMDVPGGVHNEHGLLDKASIPAPQAEKPKFLLCCILVMFYSIFGVALRIAIWRASVIYNFFPSSSNIGSNIVGCFFMGILVRSGMKTSLPYMYCGLTFGFCGSLTTFSSWVYAIVNDQESFVQLITGMSLPLVAYLMAEDLCDSVGVFKRCLPSPGGKRCPSDREMCQVLCVAIGLATMVRLGVVLGNGGNGKPEGIDAVSTVVAPFGALVRFVLQWLLNDRFKFMEGRFQIGTLAANMGAIFLYAIVHSCYRSGKAECAYVTIGICGAMSTVSSLISEFVKNYRKGKLWAYIYMATSIGLGVFVSGLDKLINKHKSAPEMND